MKVIDLINKKYNNEEMPKHIIINMMNYIYDDDRNSYVDETNDRMTIDFTNNVLNMPVEIVEDNNIDIDIESLKELETFEYVDEFNEHEVEMNRYEINRLIRVVKKLNREIKELKEK